MESKPTIDSLGKEKTSMKKLVYLFSTSKTPELSQVGGKGLSLILMTQQGLPVPPGFVLSTNFFEPWLEHIRKTPEYERYLKSSLESLKQNCEALKKICMSLQLDTTHKEILAKALQKLKISNSFLAVRSSSPEEDLEGASFAGGYETSLGVTDEKLEDGIKRSFASLFDQRVLIYKKEHGFSIHNPRIAVIIQNQVASEIAGVAFSLNPLNNCYDEAVINANFGLGESVVSGAVSPDTIIVDKVSRTILEKKVGTKETSIWLAPDGGTYEKSSSSDLCLSDEQIFLLTDILVRVEEYFKKPIDIEWAFAEGQLYLLQARPITTYIPLPEPMLTTPGEQKHLYADMTLLNQGIHEPMSVLGTDYLAAITKAMFADMMGTSAVLRADGMSITLEGRSYLNVSTDMKIMGKKRTVEWWWREDVLAADIIRSIDETEYVPKELSPELNAAVSRNIRHNLFIKLKSFRPIIAPGQYKRWYLKETKKLLMDLKGEKKKGRELSIKEIAEKLTKRYAQFLYKAVRPLNSAAGSARLRIVKMFTDEEPEIRSSVACLWRALPENIVLETGLAMYRLSQLQEIRECSSGAEFAAKLKERSFSPEFLFAYGSFMKKYGFRCPRELDVATPRFYEQPEEFFEQLQAMAQNTSAELNPQAFFDRSKEERENAYEKLLKVARKNGWLTYRLFKLFYRVLIEFEGYGEIHKYYFIMIIDLFRRRVLAAAQSLLEAGRLDSIEQVFDLTIDDLEKAMTDSSVDVRALAEKNTQFLKKIKNMHDFPRVIDSRGKVFYPPRREAGENELRGEPVSPGIVRGQVKVLRRADEKRILPGEILVTQSTDPGWMPLFVNAGGVILEVGGVLQHGALVAREYGKPCVTGVEKATSLLKDGQIVEINGFNGYIRLIEDSLLERNSSISNGKQHL